MIEQLYKNIKGNYTEAIGRMNDDERIKKYLKFFLLDESFDMLKKALESNNCRDAFNAAHTLKGISQNMSFTDLSTTVIEITEELRNGNIQVAHQIFPKLSEKYELVINEIKKVI